MEDFIGEWIRLWKEIKAFISETANTSKEYKEPIYHQTKWDLVRDTRLKSQVANNKPKHLIKKIIR